MKFKGGKTMITRVDLDKRLIVIKNYKNEKELKGIQAGVMDALENVLAIPEKSFDKYNKFRKKCKLNPVLIPTYIDVEKIKIDETNKDLENMKEFMDQNTEEEK